jgi:hypothetical protein
MATKFIKFPDALNITGNINTTGTVDGRDMSVDGAKLDSINLNCIINTASNIGTAGISLFKQKALSIFEFKNINAGSNKVIIIDDIINSEVDITIDESNVLIGDLINAPVSTVVGINDIQILTNKTYTSPIISTISNGGILTLPTVTTTLVGEITTDTLTNKTLTSPIISTILNGGTLTLPTSTDTLVGEATTNILINKSIDGPRNTILMNNVDIGLDNVNNTLVNFTATIAPVNITDDITLGYTVGSRWIDLTTDLEYICLDNSDGAAVWKVTTLNIIPENIGTSGFGIYKERISLDLQFKSIGAGNNITIVDDVANDKLVFSLNISALTDEPIPIITTDFGIVYDTSAEINKKTLLTDLVNSVAENIGTEGIGIYLQRTGFDLEFKKINSSSVAISVTDNVVTKSVDLTLDLNALTHDPSPEITADYIPVYDGSTNLVKKVLLGNLPIVLADNIGTAGVGFFKQRAGTNVEFKSAVSVVANNAILVTETIATNSIDIELDVNQLTTDNSPNGGTDYVMVYNISTSTHTKILLNNIPVNGEINTGSNVGTIGTSVFKTKVGSDLQLKNLNGINGIIISDDTINSKIDFTLDITGLSINNSPSTADYMITYDDSETLNKKALISNLPTGTANTVSNVGTGTGSVGLFKQKTGVNFEFKKINALTGIVITDITNDRLEFRLDINSLTEDLAPTSTLNYLAIYDVSETINKKTTISDITSGEINTSSNIGTTGFDIFHQKTIVDLEFNTLQTVSDKSGIKITDNIVDNKIDIELDINSLTVNTPDNTTDFLILYDTITSNHNKVLINNVVGTGEANTSSNIGTGIGIFKTKTLNNLEFKNIFTIKGIDIVDNVANDQIDISLDINDLIIDTPTISDYILTHDTSASAIKKVLISNLPNTGEANTVNTVGTGISVFKQKVGVNFEFKKINSNVANNGINVTDNVVDNQIDIELDITSLTENTSPTVTSDYIMIYSVVNAKHQKVLLNVLSSGEANTSSNIGTNIVSVGFFDSKVGSNINFKSINGQGGIVVTDNTELDISIDINGLIEDVTPDSSADFIIIYETTSNIHKKVKLSNSFSAVVASNIGIGGIGLFDTKVGSTLNFKNINSTVVCSGLLVTDDVANNEINLDLNLNALTTETVLDGSNDYILIYDTSTSDHKKVLLNNIPVASTEINTALNIGTSGVGIFKQKSGVDLEFKSLNSTSTTDGILIIDNTTDIIVKLNIDGLTQDNTPDAAQDFVVIYDTSENTHNKVLLNNLPTAAGGETNTISSVGIGGISLFSSKVLLDFQFRSINNQDGIIIIDDIANNEVKIALDINSLTEDAVPDNANDYMIVYDVSALIHKKILLNILPTATGGETNTASSVGTGVSLFKQKTLLDFEFKKINSNNANDGILITDDIVNNEIDISINIDGLTEETTLDGLTDYVVTYDVSATSYKKVLLNSLPTAAGGEINTVSNLGSGQDVFVQKIGVDLQFNKLNSTTTVILTDNITNNEIDLSLNINSLNTITSSENTDFVAIYDVSLLKHRKILLSTLPLASVTNVGVGILSIGVFKQKIGTNLEFKKINTNTLLLSDDVINNKVDLILNINGLTADITTSPSVDFIATYDTSAGLHKKILLNKLPTSGEINTASNVSNVIGSVNLFKQKVGLNFEFKKINSSGSGLEIINDTVNNEVDIGFNIFDLTEDLTPDSSTDYILIYDISTGIHKKVLIDNLPNGQTNTVSSVGTGTALFKQKSGVDLEFKNIITNVTTNGITVTNDATNKEVNITLDINGLTENLTSDHSADFTIIYDTSTSSLKKILLNDLPFKETNTVSNLGTGGITVFKNKVGVDLQFKKINGDNIIIITDNGVNDKIDISFDINGLFLDTNPDEGADFVVTYDTSDTVNKKVLINNLSLAEINTASNVGSGIGIFKQKTGINLEFKKINSDNTNKCILITDDIANNEVDISLDINSLTANASPDESTSFIVTYDTSSTTHKKVLINNLPNGEITSASSIGVGGVNIFKQKTGVNFEFKNINSSNTNLGIIITDDVVNNEVDISLDINGLTEDIAPDGAADYMLTYDTSTSTHKRVLLNTLPTGQNNTASSVGTGIEVFKQKTGADFEFKKFNSNTSTTGIQIFDNGTTDELNILLDISSLTTKISPNSTDFLVTYDTSVGSLKKVLLSDIPVAGGGEANTVSGVGVSGLSMFKQKVGANFEFKNINSTLVDDGIAIIDNTTCNHVDIALQINNLNTDAAPIASTDFIMTYDTSASQLKKVLISTLPIGEANTASNIGTVGIGLFKQKTGIDLEFKKINSDVATGVTIIDSTSVNKIDISFDISGITEDTVIDTAADYFMTYDVSATENKKVLFDTAFGSLGSNIGTAGIGVFKQKSSSTLEFKKMNSSTGIVVTNNTINNSVDISLDITELTIDTSPDSTTDYVVVYDDSVTTNKKVLIDTIKNNVPITNEFVSATTSTTVGSTSYVLINTMTITSLTGVYFVTFSSSMSALAASQSIFYGLFLNGTIIAHTERQSHNVVSHVNTMNITTHTQAIITLTGTDVVEVQCKGSTIDNITVHNRVLTLLKIS